MVRRLQSIGGWLWRVFVGAFMVQSPLFALFVVGWVYRSMQRAALKTWWKMSENRAPGLRFDEAVSKYPQFREHSTLPKWFNRDHAKMYWGETQAKGGGGLATMRAALSIAFHSLRRNFTVGAQGLFNVFVLTILPATLWQFGWYAGWDNSFNKGYEQYSAGIFISLTGIALFILVMFYLPMAQARQAVTGDWRSFYQFRVVWSIVRTRAVACMLLALAYGLISVPVTLFKTLPLFVESYNPATIEMTNAELFKYLNGYFFRAGFVFFLGYWLLHSIAARIYAKGLIVAVTRETVSIDDLSSWELDALVKLSLVKSDAQNKRHIVIRIVDTVTKPARKGAIVFATIVLWFGFVAQIYVSEFLVYHPMRGWLNQPLIQLPWYNYTPRHLVNPAADPTDFSSKPPSMSGY